MPEMLILQIQKAGCGPDEKSQEMSDSLEARARLQEKIMFALSKK